MIEFLETVLDVITVVATPANIASEGYAYLSDAVTYLIDFIAIITGWVESIATLVA
jgi:hypothetical protein